jgi:hypothetical protein
VSSLTSYKHNNKRVLKTRAANEGVLVVVDETQEDVWVVPLKGQNCGTSMVEENEEMTLLKKA